MTGEAASNDRTAVSWERVPAGPVPAPVVRTLPYLELALEHPDLEPTGYGDSFFPDAVPYEADEHRVFYWRGALASPVPDPTDWIGACATTHALTGIAPDSNAEIRLLSQGTQADEVVVEGTVAGDATVARVRSYEPPEIGIGEISPSAVELDVDGERRTIEAGTRTRIPLPERRVERLGEEVETVAVRPELAVRFPGRRELHYPAPDGSYWLFPSFGLDFEALPNPVSVPLTAGELDDGALADALGVDLSARPYPERVLWQAFAYEAFDPHADGRPRLAHLPSGHLVVESE